MTGFIIAVAVVVPLVLAGVLIKRLETVRSRDVLARFKGQELLGVCSSANCLGVESGGYGQIRGNGVLLLTEQELYFEMWLPRKEIRIPVRSIREVCTVRSHLGKSKGVKLLKVVFSTDGGGEDSCAWAVRKQEIWVKGLGKLVGKVGGEDISEPDESK